MASKAEFHVTISGLYKCILLPKMVSLCWFLSNLIKSAHSNKLKVQLRQFFVTSIINSIDQLCLHTRVSAAGRLTMDLTKDVTNAHRLQRMNCYQRSCKDRLRLPLSSLENTNIGVAIDWATRTQNSAALIRPADNWSAIPWTVN